MAKPRRYRSSILRRLGFRRKESLLPHRKSRHLQFEPLDPRVMLSASPILVRIDDVAVAEGDPAVFNATLSAPSDQPVTVHYQTDEATAIAGSSDYEPQQGTLTFAPGETVQQITVPTGNDSTVEPDEHFWVSLSQAVGAQIDGGAAAGTILDNDSRPKVDVSDVSVVAGQSATFIVSLSNPYTQTVTVDYETEEGTAKEHRDFEETEGTVTFAPGETVCLVSIPTTPKQPIEPDEPPPPARQFSLVVSNAENADLDDAVGQASIQRPSGESNSAPQSPSGAAPLLLVESIPVGIGDAVAYESASGSHARFLVHTSPPPEGVRVDWATVDGRARAQDDFLADSGTLSFGPGEFEKEILIDIVDDDTPEQDEHFYVVLSNPVNAVISTGTGTGTIIDNDTWVKIEAVDNRATEPTSSLETGDPGRFRITRYAGNYDHALTVSYTIGGVATNGTDYQAIGSSVTIPANATSAFVDITPNYDGVPEGSENVHLLLTSGSDYRVGTPDKATVTINESTGSPPPNQSQFECQFCSCPSTDVAFRADFATGSLLVCYLPQGLGYASGFDPQTMLATDIKLQPTHGAATLSGVEVATNFGGIQASPVYYSATDTNNDPVISDSLYRFGTQIDASTLYPGRYDWDVTITQRYSDNSTTVETFTGQRDLINGLGSPVGTAWGMKAQAQLFTNANGVSLMSGPEMLFFRTNDQGGYTGEDGAATLGLTGNWTNGFLLTEKDGAKKAFNSAGMLTTITDSTGNA
ncbi:MAG: Calx-beta domain-containing protein, partial [Pirellulales bacterium]